MGCRPPGQEDVRNPSSCRAEKPSRPSMNRAESCPPYVPPAARASPGRPPRQPRVPPRPETNAHKKNSDWDFMDESPFTRYNIYRKFDEEETTPSCGGQSAVGSRNSGAGYN